MRRLGVSLLAAGRERLVAEFSVEDPGRRPGRPLRARRDQGSRRAARWRNWSRSATRTAAFDPFDVFAHRVDPRLLNRRQLEALAAAGAFDGIDLNRAGIFTCAETILATAARVHDQKTSGQGGLFGESEASGTHIKLPRRRAGSRRADGGREGGVRLLLLRTPGRPLFATCQDARCAAFRRPGRIQIPENGPRRRDHGGPGRGSALAHVGTRGALPDGDDVRPIRPVRGNLLRRYRGRDLEEASRNGGCGLLTVELDRRAGEETPRVTVKRIQPFEALANTARLDARDGG